MFGDSLRRHVAAPPWQRELRDWLRRRGQVVVLIQAQKQQAAMAPTAVRKLTARTIAALARELAAIDRAMKTLIQEHASPALCSSKGLRSEEHTSELQSLMRISYAVFCLKKKKQQTP